VAGARTASVCVGTDVCNDLLCLPLRLASQHWASLLDLVTFCSHATALCSCSFG
jgi:hypothetical protein